jgi:hypothetical protein
MDMRLPLGRDQRWIVRIFSGFSVKVRNSAIDRPLCMDNAE